MVSSPKSPVAFFIFNRPEVTDRVFREIAKYKPRELFIIADGPRLDYPNDAELCRLTREITFQVDWDCEVKTNYSDKNIGVKERLITGLDWLFSYVDKAIILEDDCLPGDDFFEFTNSLLILYENDPRVALITGNNFQDGCIRGNQSYYFSNYPHIWGWGTWRRTWKKYDGQLSFWPSWKLSADWLSRFQSLRARAYWEDIFDRVYLNQINTWDYQLTASIWYSGGLVVTPNINLVSNIGFGKNASHTFSETDKNSNLAVGKIFPVSHPSDIIANPIADEYVEKRNFSGRQSSFFEVILSKTRIFIGRILGR